MSETPKNKIDTSLDGILNITRTPEELAAIEAERNPVVPAKPDKKENTDSPETTDNNDELTDERVVEFLKKKGLQFNSIDELKPQAPAVPELTAEQKEKVRKERDAKKLTYGLEKNLFTREDFEDYLHLRSNPRQVVLDAFSERYQTRKPDATPEEITAAFTAYYNEDADDTSVIKGIRAEEMQQEAQKILNKKFPGIATLDSKYDANEQEQNRQEQSTRSLTQKAEKYKTDVNKVMKGITNYSQTLKTDDFPDEITLDFTFPPESIQEVLDGLLDEKAFRSFIAQGYTAEQLNQVALDVLVKANQQKIITHFSKKYSELLQSKKDAKRRGVIPDRDNNSDMANPAVDSELREALKQYLPQEQNA